MNVGVEMCGESGQWKLAVSIDLRSERPARCREEEEIPMRRESTRAMIGCLTLGLAALLLAACTPARADPLEVTYYYLPG